MLPYFIKVKKKKNEISASNKHKTQLHSTGKTTTVYELLKNIYKYIYFYSS